MRPAVFLDRDNTLIANDGDLGDPKQVRLLMGVTEGLKALRDAGYQLVVVTNQGGVARGRYTEADVDAVHRRIAGLCIADDSGRPLIDRFYYCPYHPDGKVAEYRREHPWRKPQPGMLLQAAGDMEIDLGASWMVGDQSRDIHTGSVAGCRTVLIGDDVNDVEPTAIVETFPEAVKAILSRATPAAASPEPASPRPASPPNPTGQVLSSPEDPPSPMMFAEGKPDASATDLATALEQVAVAASTPDDESADAASAHADLQRAVRELTEEIRARRLRAAEFTSLRMLAYLAQLATIMLATLALIQLSNGGLSFMQWIAGAVLAQLFTIAILLVDLKG